MTIKEDIHNKILADITSGHYKQNEIITEASLTAKYHVSKSPVREALIELCKEQILQGLPRLGYQVVPVSLQDVVDLIDFRIDVEIAGLKRGFYNLNEASLQELSTAAHISPEEVLNPIWERNQDFHLLLYKLSQNQYGYRELQTIMQRNQRYLSQYFYNAWRNASITTKEQSCHVEIVEALKKRNLEVACHFLESDISSIKDEILKNI